MNDSEMIDYDLEDEDLELKAQFPKEGISNPVLGTTTSMVGDSATTKMDIDLTADQELLIKKMLAASTDELSRVMNVFKVYAHFQTKHRQILQAEKKEPVVGEGEE